MSFRLALALCAAASSALAIEADDLSIATVTVRPRSDYAEALYSVRNNGKTRLESAEVSCSVYDKAGELIGTGTTVIRNLKPGETGTGKDLVDVPPASLKSLGKALCRIVDAQ